MEVVSRWNFEEFREPSRYRSGLFINGQTLPLVVYFRFFQATFYRKNCIPKWDSNSDRCGTLTIRPTPGSASSMPTPLHALFES